MNMKHSLEPSSLELQEVLTALYQASFVPETTMPHYRPDGATDQWALDLRIGLSDHSLLHPIAQHLGQLILSRGVTQIVGRGYGSAFLLGGIVATNPAFCGGIIRETAKAYGFKKLIEGSIQNNRPVFLVDDVLSSGRSAGEALAVLQTQGFPVAGLATVFRYGWRRSEERLKDYQIPIYSLATLFPNCEPNNQGQH